MAVAVGCGAVGCVVWVWSVEQKRGHPLGPGAIIAHLLEDLKREDEARVRTLNAEEALKAELETKRLQAVARAKGASWPAPRPVQPVQYEVRVMRHTDESEKVVIVQKEQKGMWRGVGNQALASFFFFLFFCFSFFSSSLPFVAPPTHTGVKTALGDKRWDAAHIQADDLKRARKSAVQEEEERQDKLRAERKAATAAAAAKSGGGGGAGSVPPALASPAVVHVSADGSKAGSTPVSSSDEKYLSKASASAAGKLHRTGSKRHGRPLRRATTARAAAAAAAAAATSKPKSPFTIQVTSADPPQPQPQPSDSENPALLPGAVAVAGGGGGGGGGGAGTVVSGTGSSAEPVPLPRAAKDKRKDKDKDKTRKPKARSKERERDTSHKQATAAAASSGSDADTKPTAKPHKHGSSHHRSTKPKAPPSPSPAAGAAPPAAALELMPLTNAGAYYRPFPLPSVCCVCW